MNEEIDESEFYHQDFTTASEWEVFMARIEEIINQWRVDDKRNDSVTDVESIWDIKTEKLNFAEEQFYLYLYSKRINEDAALDDKGPKNPIDTLHDFELYDENHIEYHSCLSTWYGLDKFIVLSPVSNNGIVNESKIKVLLSSIYVVEGNLVTSENSIPLFVQIREKWQRLYLGVFASDVIRTNFEMVHLKKGLPYCNYLSGLLDLFKTKIASPCVLENIIVSAQLTYTLTEFGGFVWKQDLLQQNYDIESLFLLPFGVTVDPISSIILKATWNHLPDNLVLDSENYTDFDPTAAMNWSLLINSTNNPVCLMADAMTEFLQNLTNTSTIYDILGDFATLPSSENNPLDLLTEPAVPAISRLLTRTARQSLTRNKRSNPPLSETMLVPMLYFLFPDADEKSSFPYGREEREHTESLSQAQFKNLDEEFKGFKTCSSDSLIWRLSIILSHCLQSLGGLRAFAHVWYEFVQEMRYRWEKSMPIPGLSPGLPDLRTCLLNQKLQMLNCCIDRKIARENALVNFDSAENSSTDDEEFFDCSEKIVEEKAKEKLSLWNQPVGRLSKFGNLKLIKTGDPLYIPVTQEPVLKTEDQLEEDTDVLLQLGSNAEAMELRARIMSASLLSDMESFKAANPGSAIEDFIRWYSPRDWIEDEDKLDEWGQKAGHLSPRMLIEDNIWSEMWLSAKPVPAHRQKRLFDDTREAEKVLQFLDLRSVSQICELVIPVLSHAAIYRLMEECESLASDLAEFPAKLSNLIRKGEVLTRESKPQPRRFEGLIHEASALEMLVSQMNSLHYKLNPSRSANGEINDVVVALAMGKEVRVENKSKSDIGNRIVSMFGEAQRMSSLMAGEQFDEAGRGTVNNAFPVPTAKEFVLRTNAVKPAVYSAKCPQFMRAILSKEEFRLCGAWSEDTVFF
ncbi:unnamed protein product [Phyllotreta striolata]|uniref:Rab3 GTPase-activating protein catalytic subunit n=1 Tax=Phyllotreta striolata TaxID=444603 RepID=A0A9N9XIQ4_PHYSR|nr:unnamed protein product [Phyllotreta striolata]